MKIEPSPLEIGARIRQYRVRASLSQIEGAKRASLDWSYLGRIERGTANPSLAVLARLAAAFGIDVRLFLENENSLTQPEHRAEIVDLPALPLDQIHSMEQQLGLAKNTLVGSLGIVAHTYLQARQTIGKITDRRAQRARIRKLSQALGALSAALEPIEASDLLELTRIGALPALSHVDDLNRAGRALAPACASIAATKLSQGNEADHELHRMIGWLGQIYQEATGRTPTHGKIGAHGANDDEDDISPSPFDNMVVAFFDMIDPHLARTRLNGAVAKLWSSRQRRRVRR